jgi:hypothetical protein
MLCAATQGVPALASISQGSDAAAAGFAIPKGRERKIQLIKSVFEC